MSLRWREGFSVTPFSDSPRVVPTPSECRDPPSCRVLTSHIWIWTGSPGLECDQHVGFVVYPQMWCDVDKGVDMFRPPCLRWSHPVTFSLGRVIDRVSFRFFTSNRDRSRDEERWHTGTRSGRYKGSESKDYERSTSTLWSPPFVQTHFTTHTLPTITTTNNGPTPVIAVRDVLTGY